ncbi:MAG: hypothetical protein V3V02_00645 [Rhizobiaceae bacterium]
MMNKLHRISAAVIALYVVIHLMNHLIAVFGVDAHILTMKTLRSGYRLLLIEAVLVGSVLFQIASGVWFVWRRWGQQRGFYDHLQAVSGGYIAFFLLVHVGAVLQGRSTGLDTNFYFAAAGLHSFPAYLFFIPYYFLAVAAFFAHIACASRWVFRDKFSLLERNRIATGLIALGVVMAAVIVFTFAGGLFPMKIPAEYAAAFR